MLKWLAQRFILKQLNRCLESLDKKYDLDTYVFKVKKIVVFLNLLLSKLEDKQITKEESEELLQLVKELF